MTEKLFTGTLNHNQNKKQNKKLFNGNKDDILNLAKYIYNGFKVREEKMKQLRG